jgi:polar amino acid transport system ATP-binding protein
MSATSPPGAPGTSAPPAAAPVRSRRGDAPVVTIEALHKSFGSLEVLKGIDLAVAWGEKVAIIGPSGSGKSTLLRCVNYLEVPTSGHIYLEGELFGERLVDGRHVRMSDRELAGQRKHIGMIFQSFYLWPHLTARENVAIAPEKVFGLSRKAALELADTMLAKVHLAEKRDAYPERLSGGQQQRVAIARALAQEPKVILFDEPTSALDPELVGEVLKVIEELAAEGRSMMLVTHEIRFAQNVADRVVFVDHGVIVEQGPPAEVIRRPAHERTRAFLRQIHQDG